jgi:hypothetical protein
MASARATVPISNLTLVRRSARQLGSEDRLRFTCKVARAALAARVTAVPIGSTWTNVFDRSSLDGIVRQ